MSKPKEYASMTKDKLMTYTFGALLVLAVVSSIMWSQVTPINIATNESFMNLGLSVAIICLIAVVVAVGTDFVLYKLVSDSPLNTMSAAVFGLIVALSYSLGLPVMARVDVDVAAVGLTTAPGAFLYVALISFIGLLIFKKLIRRRVNPAAAAKLIVLLPFINSALLAKEHYAGMEAGGLSMPLLSGPIGHQVIGNNGLLSFVEYLQGCYDLPTKVTGTYSDFNWLMIVEKFHGWIGGASAIAVIIVGIALFVLARRFIKWRITLAYFVSVALMALLMTGIYGGEADVRLVFTLFIGSSIFLGFFMATDPATTPLTYKGQLVFGVGLGVLTVLIQTYMNFFGGSILALVIMNLTSPLLDRIGRGKPTTETKEPKLPKAKQFTSVKTYDCMRCGACMVVCCHKLSPILIKEAFDKMNVEKMAKLNADYCTGCGHCSFVCPARIDLKGSILRAKSMLRQQ
jgi:H+/Na+-translocating ferredoxin:NAD+ oxidoreductase subunit D